VLQDFPVAVTMGAERYTVICRDVPTAVFFYRYPDVKAGDDATTAWLLGLLTRVAVAPVLTLEHIHRLDHGAFEGVLGYCHAVGWFTDENLAHHAAMDGPIGEATREYQRSLGALSSELLPIPASVPPLFESSHMPFISEMVPVVRKRIRMVAKAGRVLPITVWNAPISETMFNYRLLIEDEQKPGGSLNALSGDDALIGFED
jgi:hypothetical protein